MSVSCEACHLTGVSAVRDAKSGKILPQIDRKSPEAANLHQMALKGDESSCKRCHFSGNKVGASSMVLPSKSILCMPCHAATFSVGDTTTIISLIVFLLGMAMIAALWVSCRPAGETEAGREGHNAESGRGQQSFGPRALYVLKVVILDILFQRRLFLQSKTRWLIHGLIFFPFLIRFLWGMVGLLASLCAPGISLPWAMLDKNAAFTGFLFDITGLMILIGVVLAAVRRLGAGTTAVSGLPKPDWPALFLIGGIVIVGFFLEGMRIAMTGTPQGAEYSFLGYILSGLFSEGVTGAYGYVWYLHAILTGAFIAYLPFSQLLHIIMSPVAMTVNAILHARDHMENVPDDRGSAKDIHS
jgi:nitrate reductase gamma subunit